MLTDVLGSLPAWPLAVLLAASVLAESGTVLGMLLPGTTAVIGLGVLAGVGAVPAPVVYVLAVGAAVAGTSLGWRAGRDGGAAVRTSRLGLRVGESRWALADDLLARRGTQAVVVAQFVVVARTLVPRIIGMTGTPWRRFARASVPAAAAWAVSLTLLGHLAGSSWDAVSALLGRAMVSVGVLAGLVLALAWLGRSVAMHPEWRSAPSARAAAALGSVARCRVEERTGGLTGGRRGQVLSALVWSAAAVLVGVLTTVVAAFAVGRTGLRSLDGPVGAWFAGHSSSAVAGWADTVVQVLRTPFVVSAAVVVALTVVLRASPGAEARVRAAVGVGGLVALALATKWVAGAVRGPAELGAERYLFLNQLPVVLTALALAVVLAGPALPWAGRVAAWTGAGAVVVVLAASRLVLGYSTVSEVVLALGVGLGWAALLASAVRPPVAGVTEPVGATRTLDGP
ncbi:VTT domain-containing protein [Arthrobacter sp. NEB 688]|uniref:DedA family protein n=1 Tax=Arthrobacter sp. NEB 688 TaxID=904039 RepID=UPI001565EAAE|nr:VTT domain-containing protein [Arthrobacter sp. NEB 688]QKE85243.1 hypothetical protein HL663_15710 [Arthrobacter sp. NEB 688]